MMTCTVYAPFPRGCTRVYLYQGILYKIPCKCKCKYKYVKQYTSARLQFILEKKNPLSLT